MILPDRGQIKPEDVERALEILETVDPEAVNLLRAYIRGLEARAMTGDMLEEEERGE